MEGYELVTFYGPLGLGWVVAYGLGRFIKTTLMNGMKELTASLNHLATILEAHTVELRERRWHAE